MAKSKVQDVSTEEVVEAYEKFGNAVKAAAYLGVDEKTIRKIEGHLRGTFANARITLMPRPKQKDSAEVYIGEEFIGVVFQDEDEDGSFMFEMAILAEDLP